MSPKRCSGILLAACLGNAALQGGVPAPAPSKEVRLLTIQDCIQAALEKNLDIRIQRYNSKIAFYSLEGSYGAWDPSLSLGGNHAFSVQGGGYTSQNIPYPPSTIEGNSFNATLTGVAPSGLNSMPFRNSH